MSKERPNKHTDNHITPVTTHTGQSAYSLYPVKWPGKMLRHMEMCLCVIAQRKYKVLFIRIIFHVYNLWRTAAPIMCNISHKTPDNSMYFYTLTNREEWEIERERERANHSFLCLHNPHTQMRITHIHAHTQAHYIFRFSFCMARALV